MNTCTDKRFADMLYAYELGLLGEEETRELEIHLLECDDCFARASQLDPAMRLIRESERIREEILKDEAAESPGEPAKSKAPGGWRRVIPIGLAAAALFILLIVQPWEIRISPRQEAEAAENRLVILNFRNLVDPADTSRLGEITASLLITDLSDSRLVDVVSSQRLDELRSLEDSGEGDSLSTRQAKAVARRARARWMLEGDILQVQPRLEITVQLLEVPSGDLVASRRVTGDDGESIFSLVDKLSAGVKDDLPLRPIDRDDLDQKVADVTTHSTDAYRWYLEGVGNMNKLYNAEAVAAFQKALQYDSTMAMAYYYLSLLADADYLEKAVEYSDRTNRKERAQIMARKAAVDRDFEGAIAEMQRLVEDYPDDEEAHYRLGHYYLIANRRTEAVHEFERVVEIDPLYKVAYNQLAYAYLKAGEYDKSIVAINKYIEIAPDEANPYDSRGDIYAAAGNLKGAIASYKKALVIKPDFPHSLLYLGIMYLFDQRYTEADSCFIAYTQSGDSAYRRANGRLYRACIPVFQGDFDEALGLLDESLVADSLEDRADLTYQSAAQKHFLKALIYREQGKSDQVLVETRRSMEVVRSIHPGDTWSYQYMYAQFLAENGQFERAMTAAKELKQYLVKIGQKNMPDYWYAMGCTKLSRGDATGAVTDLAIARETNARVYTMYMTGRAYMEAGRVESAVAEFQKILGAFSVDRANWGIWSIKSHYYLGKAYEESRWYDRAAEQYRAFLDHWDGSKAAPDLQDDARQRLTALEARP